MIFTKSEKKLIKNGLTMVSKQTLGLGEEIQAIYNKLNRSDQEHNLKPRFLEFNTPKKRYSDLKEVAVAMLEWIDAVPSDTQLPSMPGFEREWVDEILAR